MQAGLTISAAQTYQIPNQNVVGNRNSPNEASSKTTSDSVFLSDIGKNAEKNWQAIASRYDVTNISTHERGAMLEELINSGLMPPGEGIALVAPISMNHDPATKVNFFDLSRKSLEFAKDNGAPQQQIALMQKTVNLLEKLDALSAKD